MIPPSSTSINLNPKPKQNSFDNPPKGGKR